MCVCACACVEMKIASTTRHSHGNKYPAPPAQKWSNRTVAEHVCSKM